MKEQILEKIEELYNEYFKHYCELNTQLEENKDNIYTESYMDLFYDYNGESISHILDIYDEKIFPFLIGSVNIYEENVDKYKDDFEKLVEARWNERYNELKKDKSNDIFSKEVDDFVDYYDEETEALMEQNFNNMVKRVDNYSDDNVRKVTDLDDLESKRKKK